MRKAKRILAVLLAFCMVMGALPTMTPSAATENSADTTAGDLQVYNANYFGSQLTEDAEIVFYNALQNMYKNGEFLEGTVSHEVAVGTGSGQLSSDLLTGYMTGDASLLQMYQNASSAFMMDVSDLFYLDWTKLSMRVGMSDGNWSVHIGNGAYENLYLESAGYTDQTKIQADSAAMQAKISEIAEAAREYSSKREGQVEYVHDTLIQTTEYVYRGTTTVPGDTAAGALLYGQAWCEGYARAFKLIMDELGIPCVLVGGMGLDDASKNGSTLISPDVDAHMWNYVYMLDGKWYAVDVTYDDTIAGADSDTVLQQNLLKGSNEFSACHVESGVFSQNGRTFSYPEISAGNIKEGDGDGDGLRVNVSYYDKQGDNNEWTSYTVMQPAYTVGGTTLYGRDINGDGHYLYYKPKYLDSEGNDYPLYDENTWFVADYLFSLYGDRTEGCCSSYSNLYTQVGYQFAIATKATTDGFYLPDDAVVLETSEVIYFRDRYQDLRTLTPSIIDREPDTFTYISESSLTDGKVHVKYTYDMPLKLADGYTEAFLKVSTSLSGPNYHVTNLTWKNTTREGFDGSIYDCCVVEFDFYPDTSYNYSGTIYTFEPEGLVSIVNESKPRSATLTWASSAVNKFPCPYAAAPDQLLLGMYPSLLETSYSPNLFTDPVGNGLNVGSNNYDLNLTLVASKPSSSDQQEMKDAVEDMLEKEGVSAGSITSVFSLDLSLACLSMRVLVNNTLNDGSVKVCIAIPYPEGYDARSIEGTAFEAYHFSLDENGNYVPRKLTCNATDTGIWIIADSFSPFMVVARDKDEAYTVSEKTISGITNSKMADVTVRVASNDGTVDDTQIPEIVSLKEGQSCTYTFTPKSGYTLEQVIFNGNEQAFEVNPDGSYTVTYTYDTLTQDSNSLHANFCAESVLKAEAAAGFEVQNPTGFTQYIDYANELETLPGTSLREENFNAAQMQLGKTITAEIENVSGVKLNAEDLKLEAGKTAALTVTEGTVPEGSTWKSTHESVATVDENGTVTAVSEGISYITVQNANGYAICKVEVVGAAVIEVSEIILNPTEVTLNPGDEPVALTADILPEDATNASLLWTNSNPEVAVLQNGLITALSSGTTTLTATAPNGVSASCVVTVASAEHIHSYGDPKFSWATDYSLAAAVFTCEDGDDVQTVDGIVKIIADESIAPTCTEEGKTVYEATVSFQDKTYTDKQTVTIPATGHSYGEPTFNWSEDYSSSTATFTCEDGDDVQTVDCGVESKRTEPTDTENGEIVYTATVTFNDKTYTDQKTDILPATGHHYGEPKFDWFEAEDGYTCNALFTCEDHGEVQTVECEVTSTRTDATCNEDGVILYTATVIFEDKTYTGTLPIAIDATGHTYGEPAFIWNGENGCTATFTCVEDDDEQLEECEVEVIESESVAPTCTEDGKTVFKAMVTFEDKTYTDKHTVTIPATGHSYGEPTFDWAEDYSSATATFTCENCGDAQTETCSVDDETINATCTEDGEIIYTATTYFLDEYYIDEKKVTISAIGHSYDEPAFDWAEDYSAATATFVCKNCDDEQDVECGIGSETTDSTCNEAGVIVYTATAEFQNKIYSDELRVGIDPTGHTYGEPEFRWSGDHSATAVFICVEGDDEFSENCTVNIVESESFAPTCTEDGQTVYEAAVEFNGNVYTDKQTVIIHATGHSYDAPVFTWAEDYSSATATFTCAENDDQHKKLCKVESETTEPTCIEDGTIVYTATVEFLEKLYTDQQTVTLPATGHSYDKPVFNWSEDYSSATATFTCVEGDDTQIVDCDVNNKTTEPTCTEDGKTVYTATVNFLGNTYSDEQTVTISATGHNYGEPVFHWSEDYTSATATFTCAYGDDIQNVDCTVTSETNADGGMIYKATVEFNGNIYTDTQTTDAPDVPDEPDEPDEPDPPSKPGWGSVIKNWFDKWFGGSNKPGKPDEPDVPDEPSVPTTPVTPAKPNWKNWLDKWFGGIFKPTRPS